MITLLGILTFLLIYSAYCRTTQPDLKALNEFSLQNTQPLRGLLAILIILVHFALAYNQIPYLGTFEYIGGPVVGCFFFLSGFGLAISYKNKGEAYIHSFLSRRLWRILPVFIFMTLVAALVKVYALENHGRHCLMI